MSDRFYAPVSFDEPVLTLTGSEAHHMHNVLRLKQGQEVMLFDGAGTEATAEIVSTSKRSVELRILEKTSTPPGAKRSVILGTAVPKGDRFRWLVEKATELGVTRLVPLITERSVVEPGSGKLEKMKQTVIAACKQSGRNRLMAIDEPTDWNRFIDQESQSGLLFVAHPTGAKPATATSSDSEKQPIILAVGPEGGLTETEISTAVNAKAKLISLGPNILRIETAAVALAAIFSIP
jgi:16S rRNA (uracil1498-N3)-methyltransferase